MGGGRAATWQWFGRGLGTRTKGRRRIRTDHRELARYRRTGELALGAKVRVVRADVDGGVVVLEAAVSSKLSLRIDQMPDLVFANGRLKKELQAPGRVVALERHGRTTAASSRSIMRRS